MILTIVYQAGLANVFDVTTYNGKRARTRVLQSDFRSCELFCQGARYAGARVRVAFCNRAGDIADCEWDTPSEHAPFKDSMLPQLAAGEWWDQ